MLLRWCHQASRVAGPLHSSHTAAVVPVAEGHWDHEAAWAWAEAGLAAGWAPVVALCDAAVPTTCRRTAATARQPLAAPWLRVWRVRRFQSMRTLSTSTRVVGVEVEVEVGVVAVVVAAVSVSVSVSAALARVVVLVRVRVWVAVAVLGQLVCHCTHRS